MFAQASSSVLQPGCEGLQGVALLCIRNALREPFHGLLLCRAFGVFFWVLQVGLQTPARQGQGTTDVLSPAVRFLLGVLGHGGNVGEHTKGQRNCLQKMNNLILGWVDPRLHAEVVARRESFHGVGQPDVVLQDLGLDQTQFCSSLHTFRVGVQGHQELRQRRENWELGMVRHPLQDPALQLLLLHADLHLLVVQLAG